MDDVQRALKPLWHAKPETADKVRQGLQRFLDYAKARGLRSGDNPAAWAGHLDKILPKPAKLSRGHHAAMPFVDLPTFAKRLRKTNGTAARALEFLILTAVRSGEARGARWEEIDFAARVWTIPAERMKANKEHRVPLSPQALAVIEVMKARRVNDFVFPGHRAGRPLTDMSLTKVLNTAGASDFTVHGMRSSFRDWVSDATLFQREVAEAALAHQLGDKVERAYRRGDALEKRRELMDAWASFVNGDAGASP